MDSRTLRTHPSQCSTHYFPADTITAQHWSKIADYPSDILGKSVLKKIGSFKKDQQSTSQPFMRRITDNFKEQICAIIDTFYNKLGNLVPFTDL